MGHVFISYARSDTVLAALLASELHRNGVSVWLDTQEILPGDNWAEAIEAAIKDAIVYIVLLSNKSLASSWVQREAQIANSSLKIVIPILLEEISPDTLPLWLRPYHYLRFDSGNLQQAIAELLTRLPHSVRETQVNENKRDLSKGYVFISYVEEDGEFVDKLIEFFDKRNYGYWDFLRSDREYQLPFHIELEKAIGRAAATLCVISPEWKQSIWTPKEYLYSEQVKTPTIVLMYRDSGATLLIADRTYIDFTKDESQGFSKLDRELKRRGLI